ncbi:restriction endonuclease subunit S [Candidatus Poriferisodalis sp.]|uniref:restriction endonuclease subunit S n=1 Tax=Candidatus Poriferisodalis sp. TaxID=3101277 RepID=UPI003B59CD99
MKRAYAEYRASGLPGTGDIPAHWRVADLGRVGSFFKGGGGTKDDETDEGHPCVRYGDLYTQHEFCVTETRSRISPERTGAYTQLQYGDLLFAGSGETLEEIGKSAVNLLQEPTYCGGDVIILRPDVDIDATFLGYAADCAPSRHEKACMGRGVTVMHIYSAGLKKLAIPLPPLDEQVQISAYLDLETTQIDKLISKQELLIERLDEYRTALITRTVTRGLPPEAAEASRLDPIPALRDSGVEWLGDVPAHWRLTDLCRIGSFSKGGGGTKEDETAEGLPCIRYGDLYTRHDFHIHECRARIDPERATAYTQLHYGDLLLAGSGETLEEIGKSAVNLLREQAFCGGDVVIFRPEVDIDATFLGYAADCSLSRHQKSCMGRGVTVMHIYSSALKKLAIPLPPLGEQVQIGVYLDAQSKRIDELRERAELSIERLAEYRSALISAAVTGKIDVRDTASAGSGGGA